MGFDQDKEKTPMKLSYFAFPAQSPESPCGPGMLTPPVQTSASIPFHWEEAPGKPRSYVDDTKALPPKAARTLDLPPRLAKIVQTPSPTAVLDGPYQVPRGDKGRMEGDKGGFGSWRWGSVRERSEGSRGSFDFSYSISGSRCEGEFSKARIGKLRKRSFFGVSKSHTWAKIYDNVKQAVHWRRKQ